MLNFVKATSTDSAGEPRKTDSGKILVSLLLFLVGPSVVQGQFNFVTNNGAITITGYTGPGGEVVIPQRHEWLPCERDWIRSVQ